MLTGFTRNRMVSVDEIVIIIRQVEKIFVTVFLIPLIHRCKVVSKVEIEEIVEKALYLRGYTRRTSCYFGENFVKTYPGVTGTLLFADSAVFVDICLEIKKWFIDKLLSSDVSYDRSTFWVSSVLAIVQWVCLTSLFNITNKLRKSDKA